MGKTSPNPGSLTVIIGGQPVGTVKVAERYCHKVLGNFAPSPEFEPHRPIFETAVELARQFDATPTTEPCNYALWERLVAAYGEIKRLGPVFAEAPYPIEEFAVEADWSVEVTFEAIPA